MMTPVLMARVLTHAMAIHEASYTIWVAREINPEREGISMMDVPNYDPDRPLYRRKDDRQTQEHGYYTIDENKAISLALDAYQLPREFIEPLAQLMSIGYSELWDWCDDLLGPKPFDEDVDVRTSQIVGIDIESHDANGRVITSHTIRTDNEDWKANLERDAKADSEAYASMNESSPWFQKYQKD